MKDYNVIVKVRNNRIIKAIQDIGGKLGNKWCEDNDLKYGDINDLINLKASPLSYNGDMRDVALRLCDAVNKLPEELWSKEQLYPLEKNFSEIEMDHGEIQALISSEYNFDNLIEEDDKIKSIKLALEKLTKREQKVIQLRYFEDKKLEEIGNEIGLSKERARQIEARAIRKLRSSKNQILLGDFA